MAYVITRLCRDCVDSSCVEVCPVECIVEHRPAEGSTKDGTALPNQLFINPETCIDCAACEPACPWEAIALDADVPRLFADDVALNALAAARPNDFVPATIRTRPRPSPAQVDDNRRRWELESEAAPAE